MLNLKSDPGLNYLLKFHDFICSIRRESHLRALKIKVWRGRLLLIRAFTATSTDPSAGHNLPSTASFCVSFIVIQIDWFKTKERSVALWNYPGIGRAWSFYLLFASPKVQRVGEKAMNVYDFRWKRVKLPCKRAAHPRLKLVFGLMFSSRYDFPMQPTIPSLNSLFINTILPAFGPSLTATRIKVQYKQISWFRV